MSYGLVSVALNGTFSESHKTIEPPYLCAFFRS